MVEYRLTAAAAPHRQLRVRLLHCPSIGWRHCGALESMLWADEAPLTSHAPPASPSFELRRQGLDPRRTPRAYSCTRSQTLGDEYMAD
jgi:hypothetical protein